jgi:uncharacterized repeat protein (TIGR03943 family)
MGQGDDRTMLKPWRFIQNLSQAIAKSSLNTPSVESEDESPAIDIWVYAEPASEEADPLKRNVLQWRRLISSVREPLDEFPGQAVNLVGFVHYALREPPDQFTLARQIIRCCLADTVPLGLVVLWEGKPFAPGTWLQIQGQFTRTNERLAIAPATIKEIPPPQKLYINGVF